MLQLLETHCVSVLSYVIEVVQVTDKKQKSKMRVAYNSIFRKLFGYSWRESVTELQHALGRPTWEELIAARKKQFPEKVSTTSTGIVGANSELVILFAVYSLSILKLSLAFLVPCVTLHV